MAYYNIMDKSGPLSLIYLIKTFVWTGQEINGDLPGHLGVELDFLVRLSCYLLYSDILFHNKFNL